jgi:hypothetical protein
VNSQLSAASFTANATLGTTTITFNLTRLNPDNKILANAVSTTVNVVEPTAGQLWQGGYYVGKYNPTTGSTTTGLTHYLVQWTVFGPGNAGNFSDGSAPAGVLSYHDGLTNTNAYDGNNLSTTVIGYARNYSASGYTDWYQGARTEVDYALKSNPQRSENVASYWTSTYNYDINVGSGTKYVNCWSFTRNTNPPYNPTTDQLLLTWTQANDGTYSNILGAMYMRRIAI